ncbi:hypothetical protein AMTR_s00062p00169680 [Amborella trichopoda]|uniref:Uncharacterized protein n=1 Tax=Amborella trichopoda TaxID=13333 RepID=U5DGV7_AMBTC|nr:hypothetical protein AMTR_s00062p00169680 [Amborella trichopoda]
MRKAYAYHKLPAFHEDPEEQNHRLALYLIAKTLEKADRPRRRPSFLRLRLCKLRIRLGKQIRKLKKRIQMAFLFINSDVCIQLHGQLKFLKSLFRGKQAMASLQPPYPASGE